MATNKAGGRSRRKAANAEGAANGASSPQNDEGRTQATSTPGVGTSSRGEPEQRSASARQANPKGRRSASAPSERHLHAASADEDPFIVGTIVFDDGRRFVGHQPGSRQAREEVERLREETTKEEREYLLDRGSLRGGW